MNHGERPPRLAGWLLSVFASEEQPVLADLGEEFSSVAARDGLAASRRWYWRQAAKTAPRLFSAQLALHPWQTSGALASGLSLLWLVNIPQIAVTWNFYPDHWPLALRLLWIACWPVAAMMFPPGIAGGVVGRVTKGQGAAAVVLFTVAVLALRLGVAIALPPVLPGPPYVHPASWSAWWLRYNPIGSGVPPAAFVWPAVALLAGLIANRGPHRGGATSAPPAAGCL